MEIRKEYAEMNKDQADLMIPDIDLSN